MPLGKANAVTLSIIQASLSQNQREPFLQLKYLVKVWNLRALGIPELPSREISSLQQLKYLYSTIGNRFSEGEILDMRGSKFGHDTSESGAQGATPNAASEAPSMPSRDSDATTLSIIPRALDNIQAAVSAVHNEVADIKETQRHLLNEVSGLQNEKKNTRLEDIPVEVIVQIFSSAVQVSCGREYRNPLSDPTHLETMQSTMAAMQNTLHKEVADLKEAHLSIISSQLHLLNEVHGLQNHRKKSYTRLRDIPIKDIAQNFSWKPCSITGGCKDHRRTIRPQLRTFAYGPATSHRKLLRD
ncbi:hypothetical protein BJ741DRAFT_659089 [Chytriomyces cf. hyalinus JEL632]|nr:hypothetical protein BJ741DRAFT_661149 [Chytriomyces cf. hyalinus JEL632]KAI8846047.1 hypothetical protein BJ741DRAFT_659089 [Chytriomyces cf. hyalinus JEL632]